MIFSAVKRFSARQRKGEETARAFARCFATEDGQIVLEYLHQQVLFRTSDPNMPEAHLRFLEGQKQLVLLICQMMAKPTNP